MKKMKSNDAAIRLQAVFETAIDGIVTIDERGIVESLNPAAARLFGYSEEEVIGKNINMLMPSPYHEQHDQYLENYHRTGEPKIIGIGREVEGKKKDGTIFPIRLAVSEAQLENGKQIFTGIIHDLTDVKTAESKILGLNKALSQKNEMLEDLVTERTEKLASVIDRLLNINNQLENEVEDRQIAEQNLRRREKELEASLEKEKELNVLKSRFVSMASHEFRTPLSTILSSIELVEAYGQESHLQKRTKHIDRIKTSVRNLTDILKDFLSLSRLEEGKIATQPELFDFYAFCEDLKEEAQSLLKKGQEIIHEHEHESKEVFLDKKMLRNIFINLLSNAIKYSKEGQPIICRTVLEKDRLEIAIADKGIGIPEEEQSYLFTRFFRARNVENIQGTGLGLNIVKRYLDLMDGQITFESQLGKGTTFYITIPLKQGYEKDSYH